MDADEGPTRLLHQPPLITLSSSPTGSNSPREMFSYARETPTFARDPASRQSVVMPMRKGYGEVRAHSHSTVPASASLARPSSIADRRTVSEPMVSKDEGMKPRKTVRKQMSLKKLFNPSFAMDQPVPALLPAAEIREMPAGKSLAKRFSLSNLSNSFKRRNSSPEQPPPPPPLPRTSIPESPLVESPESISSPLDCDSLYSIDYPTSLSLGDFLASTEPESQAQIRQVVVRRPERATYFITPASGSKSSLDTDESEPTLATPVSVQHKWTLQMEKLDVGADPECDADLRGLGLEFDEWQDRLPICELLSC